MKYTVSYFGNAVENSVQSGPLVVQDLEGGSPLKAIMQLKVPEDGDVYEVTERPRDGEQSTVRFRVHRRISLEPIEGPL